MIKEFDGQTEKEAVQNAIEALNIKDFEYEVISETKKGLFKKPSVRIRVILEDDVEIREEVEDDGFDEEDDEVVTEAASPEPENETERKILDYLAELYRRMDFVVKPCITARGSTGKLYVNLECDDTSLVIGYRGERLDAIQIIATAYCLNKCDNDRIKVILDVDGYRERHESKIIKDALFAAKKVRMTGRPLTLDPLNSYERRLVHKALDDFGGVMSESQGNGLMKRIKIFKTR